MPWISPSVWEEVRQRHADEVRALREDNAWLQAELSTAYTTLRMLERKAHNLPVNDAPKKPREEDVIPPDIMAMINMYESPAREELLSSVRMARRENTTWEVINREIRSRLPPVVQEAIEG